MSNSIPFLYILTKYSQIQTFSQIHTNLPNMVKYVPFDKYMYILTKYGQICTILTNACTYLPNMYKYVHT